MSDISLDQLDKDIAELQALVEKGQAPNTELDRLLRLRAELQDATAEDWEAYDFLFKHLPIKSADDLVVILKGHLLIEYLVRKFIDRRMLNPDALPRLTSFQSIKLAEALCLQSNESKWLWARVGELNALRNSLAHKLKLEGVKQQIDNFVREINAYESLQSRTLSGAIARLYGMLKGLADLAKDPQFQLPR